MQIKNSKFFCSLCGCSITRTVDADAQIKGGATAYFCRERCARLHRMSGMEILSLQARYAIHEMVKNRWEDKYIAEELNLSLVAVQAQAGVYRRELFPPPKKTKANTVRKSMTVPEEDDIFAPLVRTPAQQEAHEQRK